MEAFFLDDEAGTDEGARDDGQDEADEIARVHGFFFHDVKRVSDLEP